MATLKLYYTDSYLRVFDAQVVAIADGGERVYLNQTAFYPTSGGQPHDLGALNGISIVDIHDEDGRIAHVLANPIQHGPVTGEVEWKRRFDHMQQHTGQHLLSAALLELFSIPTLSFHMGAETSTIELGTKDLTEDAVCAVESRCNQYVREGRPVQVEFAEAEEVQGLRKASARSGTLRVINIEGVDRSACGGTHVRSTAEIGTIQIRRQERIRGNVRVEFLCGDRATRQVRRDFSTLNELAKLLSVPFTALPEQVGQIRHRLALAEKETQRLKSELGRREGLELHAATLPMADGIRRVSRSIDEIDEPARAQALAFTGAGLAIIILFAPSSGSVLVSCSVDSGRHAGNELREALAKVDGRGGGSATLAQGNLSNPKILEQLAAGLGFEAANTYAQNSEGR